MDSTVTVPSLWGYVDSLGGTYGYYGWTVAAFALGRLLFMGVFGAWSDTRPFREVFTWSLGLGMLCCLLYALAPTLGLWSIWVSRALLGCTTSVSVSTQAYVASNTSVADRTRYMSINAILSGTLVMLGPAFNVFLVALPEGTVSIGSLKIVFNSYTQVGYFLFFAQLVVLMLVLLRFKEPTEQVAQRKPAPLGPVGSALTLWGLFPWPRVFLDPWIWKTGCWLILLLNFRNMFVINAMLYAIPIVTDRDYGYGQKENSILFVAVGVISTLSMGVIAVLSKRVADRMLILCVQLVSWTGLVAFAVCTNLGMRKVPLALLLGLVLWYVLGFSGPVNQSLYSKMIGEGNGGLYFAVLQSNGAIAAAISGQVVGVAYNSLGPPSLWLLVHIIWALTWLAFLAAWRGLEPSAIAARLARLRDEYQEREGASLQPLS